MKEPAAGEPPVLQIEDLRKVYGGEVALGGVSLTIAEPCIHGLLGANGAGKSTLVRIVSGVENSDGGTIAVRGETLSEHSVGNAAEAGIAYIDQDRALIADLSIAENIALTLGYPLRGGLVSPGEMRRIAREALAGIELDHDVDSLVGELPISDQTMVAVARALWTNAKLILLDEPTSNLGRAEAEWLFEQLNKLVADGVTCVLITHALVEALSACQDITVLRDGHVVATESASNLDEHIITEMMAGPAEVDARPVKPSRRSPDREPVLEIDGLRYDRLGPLSLELHPGEILGITGLADTGHFLLGEALTGGGPISGGKIRLKGDDFVPKNVNMARDHGLVTVPPDRINQGLALELTARENLFLDGESFGGLFGINRRRERREAARILAEADVKPPSPEAVLSTLSGGNLQKVLIAKWLSAAPDAIALCEPTIGVDVRARDELYVRLRAQVDQGLGVLLLSSDFDEVVELSDRVIVLRYGIQIAQLEGDAITSDRIAALASSTA